MTYRFYDYFYALSILNYLETMSCVIEQFERFNNGQLVVSYPQTFLRGSNIVYFGINKR